ncbi:MAG TPA: bifunctional cytidylyltransferase/SDR family oxidoreductase [Candidatus Limnocylindrales bacterium]|jgi:2-C-methyl-D-erythritol 4-phosphate cytidylyltransferase
MQIHAIVLAGGNGNRFGAEMPKQFVRLAGDPILVRGIRAIASAGVDRMVVVAHPNWVSETVDLVASAGVQVPTAVVAGGMTRNESTANGLRSLAAADDDVILVHDAVRPLVPVEVILRSIEPILLGRADATDTVIPSADTLVVVDGDDVVEIPDRSRYRRGQTPQVFRKRVLAAAYEAAARAGDLSATDDCSLVLRYVPGARIVAVAGDEVNLKITTRIDMVVADRMLQMQTMSPLDGAGASRPLRGARILVVGGTNGIGQSIAAEAERLGATVAVDGRSRGLDVRDHRAVAARVKLAAERLGGLDHVVCTAGVLRIGSLADMTPEEYAEVVDVNVTGTLNVARAAYRHLRRSRGSFTVFASSSFTRGRPDYVAYSASKAAVVNLAQGLAEEWGRDGIRVNAVSPERTDTPMRRRAFPNESSAGMLAAADVAVATLALMQSDLTGQVLDVRRHDPLCAPAASAPKAVSEPEPVRRSRPRRTSQAAPGVHAAFAGPGAAGE